MIRRALNLFRAAIGGTRPTITYRVTESRIYTINRWHMRRALVGGWLARECFGFTSNGTQYGVDFAHGGSSADCTQNASLASATRIAVTLGSGDQTATQAATSIAAAIEAATTCTVTLGTPYTTDGVECVDITITGATDLWTPPLMNFAHEAERGMWGVQRTDYGTGNTGTSAAVGATASYHFTAPSFAHRCVGAYAITTGGAADLRMGVATGPAYSTTPAAFSDGVEANAGQASSDGTRVAIFGAVTKTSAQDVWVTWRGTATATIRTRSHGSSPVGNGDAVVGERILSNATPTDPATAIYTAGAYTHSAPSTFTAYPAVGYLYERTDGNGDYYSTSNVRTYDGYHRALSTDGTTGIPTVLDDIHESFRRRVPWPCRVGENVYFDLANNTSGEDGYFEIYDWTAASSLSSVAPTGSIPKLLDHGRCNASTGGGRKTITTTGVVADTDDVVAPSWHWGRVDRALPLTTVTTRYDAPGAAAAYLTGWGAWTVREGSEWCDMTDSGEPQGLGLRGVDCQYLAQSTGDMPVGQLDSGDDPYDVNASDLLPDNHFRHAISYERIGCGAP